MQHLLTAVASLGALALLVAPAASAQRILGGKIAAGSLVASPPPSGGAWLDTFGPCTFGTDCLCDKLGTTGTVNGPYTGIRYCEDWDHDAFWATNPTDVNDAYGNNNWISTSGAIFGSTDRGGGSRWAKKYAGTWSGMTWYQGEPTTACGGVITDVSSFCGNPDPNTCYGSGPKEWDASDRWCANAYEPRIDIIHLESEYSAENGSNAPVIPGSGGETIFGDNIMAHRVGQFEEQGFHSDPISLGGTVTQLGITRATAFESNLVASTILTHAWKFDEFDGAASGQADDGLFGFRQIGGSDLDTFPFHGFIFPRWNGDFTVKLWGCADAIDGNATAVVGSMFCDLGDSLIWQAQNPTYSFSGQWAIDEWHCMSALWDFTDIANVSLKMWHDGALVVHLTGLNFANSAYDGASDGITSFKFNNYSNKADTNAEVGGGGGLTDSTRRYTGPYVMRAGTPVLCEDIGFPSSYNQVGL